MMLSLDYVQAEVKRLTTQVEEAAKKNRQLIDIGCESHPRKLLDALHFRCSWSSFFCSRGA
jgi:hypothetical protein